MFTRNQLFLIAFTVSIFIVKIISRTSWLIFGEWLYKYGDAIAWVQTFIAFSWFARTVLSDYKKNPIGTIKTIGIIACMVEMYAMFCIYGFIKEQYGFDHLFLPADGAVWFIAIGLFFVRISWKSLKKFWDMY